MTKKVQKNEKNEMLLHEKLCFEHHIQELEKELKNLQSLPFCKTSLSVKERLINQIEENEKENQELLELLKKNIKSRVLLDKELDDINSEETENIKLIHTITYELENAKIKLAKIEEEIKSTTTKE